MELNMSDSVISNFVVSYGGKDADIDIVYRDGQKFFSATKLWQAFSGKETERVYDFLRLDDTKRFLFQKYIELTDGDENSLIIKSLSNSSNGRVSIPHDISAYLASTHKQSLPTEILDPFVHTKRGQGGGTYLSEVLFIDYAMKLSAQIKSVVIDTFRKYGWIEALPQEKRVDALLELTVQEEMKSMPDFQADANQGVQPRAKRKAATARVEGKITTNLLKENLANVMGLGQALEDQQRLANLYSAMFGTIYQCLFKHNAKKMLDYLEKTSGTPRDYMTEECLYAIAIVEAELKMELLQMFKHGHKLDQAGLIALTKECCEKPAKNLFKYESEIDFLFSETKKDKNTVKCLDVALNNEYEVSKKETWINPITRLPISEAAGLINDPVDHKKNESKASGNDKKQLSFFDSSDN
jgi:hypothetical protein